MSTEIDDLINEITTKTGVALAKNDPVLILFHANRHLLNESFKRQEEMVRQFNSSVQEAQQQWVAESKQQSEKVVNVAIQAAINEMDKLAEKRTTKLAENLAEILAPALNKLQADINKANRVAVLNVVSAGLTLAAVVIGLPILAFF